MSHLKRIIAAVDFSTCADAALAHACRLAQAGGAEVIALHTVQPLLYNRAWLDREASALLPTVKQLMKDAAVRLHSAVAAHAVSCNVREEVVEGHALGTILEWCERLRPDLLVLGAHSTLDAYRHMGYTASGAVRKAAAPVLAVHASLSGAFKCILVATDFSETSATALRHSLRLALLDKSDVEVLHAYPDPWGGHSPPQWHRDAVPDFAERYEQRVLQHIEAWAQPFLTEAPGVRVSYAAVQHASPGQAIVERAMVRGADLVTMGTKGTTNLRSMFLGSTAEGVLRKVPCSVLAVKPDGLHDPLAAGADPRAPSSRPGA